MWLCILTDRQFEETYENAQGIKARQMQAMWICIFLCRPFEETFENAQCNQCDYALYRNVTYVTLHPPGQTIWGHIWKRTLEKSQTNATNVTMHPHTQAIWGHIWKHTAVKSQTTATNVTLPHLGQAIWEDIWWHTIERMWRIVWKRTVEKTKKCNQWNFTSSLANNFMIHIYMKTQGFPLWKNLFRIKVHTPRDHRGL